MQVSCRSAVLCDVDLDHLGSAHPQGRGAQCDRIGSCRNQGSRGNQRAGMSRRDGPDADVEAEDLLLEACRRSVCEDVVLPFCGKVLIEDKVPVLQQSRVDVQEGNAKLVYSRKGKKIDVATDLLQVNLSTGQVISELNASKPVTLLPLISVWG